MNTELDDNVRLITQLEGSAFDKRSEESGR